MLYMEATEVFTCTLSKNATSTNSGPLTHIPCDLVEALDMPTRALKGFNKLRGPPAASEQDHEMSGLQALRKRRPTPCAPTIRRLEPVQNVTNRVVSQKIRVNQCVGFSQASHRNVSPETDTSTEPERNDSDDDEGVFRFSWPEKISNSTPPFHSGMRSSQTERSYRGMADDWFEINDFAPNASPLLPTPSPEAVERPEYTVIRLEQGQKVFRTQSRRPKMTGHKGPLKFNARDGHPMPNFSYAFPVSPPPSQDERKAAPLKEIDKCHDLEDWRGCTPAQRQVLRTRMAQQFSTWNFANAAAAHDEQACLLNIFTSETLDPKDQANACAAESCANADDSDDVSVSSDSESKHPRDAKMVTETVNMVAVSHDQAICCCLSCNSRAKDEVPRAMTKKDSHQLSSSGQKTLRSPPPSKRFSAGLSQVLQSANVGLKS